MFRSKHRGKARQQPEDDALLREADRLADAVEAAPDYRRQITSDRAARVLGEIGEPLARDARASGPELTGGELDRELDRLAQLYPEPGLSEPAAVTDPRPGPRGREVTAQDATEQAQDAARSGHDTASFIITTQANRGMSADAIQRHHEDQTAWMLSQATTPDSRAFARAYAEAAATLVADLRELDRPVHPPRPRCRMARRTLTPSWPGAAGRPRADCTSAGPQWSGRWKRADLPHQQDNHGPEAAWSYG